MTPAQYLAAVHKAQPMWRAAITAAEKMAERHGRFFGVTAHFRERQGVRSSDSPVQSVKHFEHSVRMIDQHFDHCAGRKGRVRCGNHLFAYDLTDPKAIRIVTMFTVSDKVDNSADWLSRNPTAFHLIQKS